MGGSSITGGLQLQLGNEPWGLRGIEASARPLRPTINIFAATAPVTSTPKAQSARPFHDERRYLEREPELVDLDVPHDSCIQNSDQRIVDLSLASRQATTAGSPCVGDSVLSPMAAGLIVWRMV